MTNDDTKARAAFTAARAEQEKRVQAQPNYGPGVCVLGLIDAGLGRKEDALREGGRAVELLPVEKDAIDGMHMVEHFAIIAAWVGEKDLACEQLAIATRLLGYVSYGQLKLLPWWASSAAIRASRRLSPLSRRGSVTSRCDLFRRGVQRCLIFRLFVVIDQAEAPAD